jgi:chromosome segregation ATPase
MKMSANIDNMLNEFKHYYFQQKAKATQETKRLSEENHRLIDEVFFLKTTNKHLEQNLKLKTDRVEDLEECNKMLNEDVVKLNKCLIGKVKTIKDLVNKHSIHNENQQKLQFELKRNEQLLERFQNRCKLLVENRIRLTEEKNRLINILNEEMKNIRETVAKKQQIINEMKSFSDDLKSKLDFQIESNYKQLSIHKNEVLKMKLSFNSQLTSLKKQRQYFKRYNEINVSFCL